MSLRPSILLLVAGVFLGTVAVAACGSTSDVAATPTEPKPVPPPSDPEPPTPKPGPTDTGDPAPKAPPVN